MNIKNYFLILLLTCTIGFGQKKNYNFTQEPLTNIIPKLEKNEHIYFSYASGILENIWIDTSSKNLNFQKLIKNIEEQSHLVFQKVSETQYIISVDPLKLKTQYLNPVVLTSYITSGIDRNKDGSIDIKTDDLGILPGLVSKDISQSIQLIPGISTLDESATGIQIRGGSPDQNLILYNNIKLFNTGYFYGMFSLFNPFSTEKARVFRSGTSAAYGDRISGIIDISSGDKIPTQPHGGFELDGLSINGFLKTPLSKKVGLYVFARRSYSDLYRTPTYDSYADKIFTNAGTYRDINGNKLDLETDDDFTPKTSTHDFSFADFSTKIIINPDDNNHIAISAMHTENIMDFGFGDDKEKIEDRLNTENNGLSFNWKHITNDKQKEEITAYYSYYNSFYKNDELKDKKNDVFDGIFESTEISLRTNRITEFGVNLTSTTQINDKQKLTLGYQLSNTKLKVGISKEKPFEPEENQNDPQTQKNFKNALFGEYTFYLNNKSFVNTGLRLVHYNSVNEIKLEPRINLEYAISKNLRVKTAIEQRNQPISQLIEFNHTELRLENNLWRLSDNIEYPLLTSNQVSGGFLYKYKNLNIDIDSYYKTLKGLTTFTNGFSNPLENLEEGKSIIKGLDILLKYKWNNYRVWTGYTYNDITFQFPTLSQKEFPGNNDITHSFRISNSLKLKNWQFSLGWQFRSGKPLTPVNNFKIEIDQENEKAGVVRFGNTNSERLPNFHRLDASVLYDFNLKSGNKTYKSQIGLSALNLYNRIKPLNVVYKAEVKPLDDGGIPKNDGSGENELILEQVIQRFSLGFTPNISFKIFL